MSFTLLRLLTSKVVYHAVEQDQNIVNQFIVTVVRQGFGTYFDKEFISLGPWNVTGPNGTRKMMPLEMIPCEDLVKIQPATAIVRVPQEFSAHDFVESPARDCAVCGPLRTTPHFGDPDRSVGLLATVFGHSGLSSETVAVPILDRFGEGMQLWSGREVVPRPPHL